MSNLNVTVLGSGIIGLTTALQIKQELRTCDVTIVADQFLDSTTSAIAAGIFIPPTGNLGETKEITQKWIDDSYYFWEELGKKHEPLDTGIKGISGYIFSSQHSHIVKNEFLEKLVPVYRAATESELKICPGQWKYGSYFETILTDPSLLLPYLSREVERSGVQVVQQTIESFNELNCDVLVNCTGLGAKILCNDNKLVALRGQVIKVEAPQIKQFVIADYDTHIFPGFKSVTLGGCRQYESYNLNVDKYDGQSIIERCRRLVPSLKDARVVKQLVGLRPHRSTIRVEKETLYLPSKTIRLVHNYGHGGYGYTTAPGTAMNAVKLVKESLAGNSKL